MKVIIYILLYISLTVGYYFLLSTIGCIFGVKFSEIISNPNWFVIYMVGFHWWLVIFSLFEYHYKYIKNNPALD